MYNMVKKIRLSLDKIIRVVSGISRAIIIIVLGLIIIGGTYGYKEYRLDHPKAVSIVKKKPSRRHDNSTFIQKTPLTQSSPTQSSQATSPTSSTPPTQSSGSPSISTAQLDQTRCAELPGDEENAAQSSLLATYNSEIQSVIANGIDEYNLYPASFTVAMVDNLIQAANNVDQSQYQEQLVPIQAYAEEYGCSISLTQEPTLPSFNPPAIWP